MGIGHAIMVYSLGMLLPVARCLVQASQLVTCIVCIDCLCVLICSTGDVLCCELCMIEHI